MAGWNGSNGVAYYTYAMGTNQVKPSTDHFNVALFTNGVNPTQSASVTVNEYTGAGSTWDTSNETLGTGYTAGGASVTPITWGQNVNAAGTNVITFTSSGTPQWTGATFTAYGAFVYNTNPSTITNLGISWNWFGGLQQVTAGSFTINWSTSGICTWTTGTN